MRSAERMKFAFWMAPRTAQPAISVFAKDETAANSRHSEKGMVIIMRKFRILRPAVTGICIALLLLTFLASVAADAASVSSQPAIREVGSSAVYLFGNRQLTGSSIARYSRGERLNVVYNGDGSCTVYNERGETVGYCSPVDLVEPGTALFVQVPYLYGTDASGNPQVFDLIDLDLYLAENASNIYKNVSDGGEEKIVLIARRLLEDLEAAAGALAAKGIGLRVDTGYRADESVPVEGMAAYNTGCVLGLVLIKDNAELNRNPSSAAFRQAEEILLKNGFFLGEGDRYSFCYVDFESCYGVNLNVEDLPRVALD